ncbi:MAG: hypothetical protein ATN36_05850 [Epulopiscium sp. Nele67-Bin005]|nr:MAG: hypothetical protein ATN36_05850 [Epulopiscium sp. Nele67-Bin005]
MKAMLQQWLSQQPINKHNIESKNAKGAENTAQPTTAREIVKNLIAEHFKDGQISGTLMQGEDKDFFLQLGGGERLPVLIGEKLPLNQETIFNGELTSLGELLLTSGKQEKTGLSDQVMERLNLPKTPQMKACVDSFISKGLPLEKQDLIKAHFNVKQYDLPTEVVTNLAKKAVAMPEQELQIAKEIVNKGPEVIKEPMLKIVEQDMTPKQQNELSHKLDEYIEKHNIKMPTEPDKPKFTKISDNTSQEQIVKPDIPKFTVSEKIEQILTPNVTRESHFDMTPPPEFELLAEDLEKVQPDFKEVAKAIEKPLEPYEVVTKIIEEVVEDESEELAPKLSKENTLPVEKTISNEIEKEILLDKGIETKELDETEKKELNKLFESNKTPIEENLDKLKQNLEVANKLQNDGQYYMISPMLHENIKKGEIHFFDPQKNPRSKQEGGLYIVVALDMGALEHIQLHIHKNSKDLSIQFLVEAPEIRNFIQGHMPKLLDGIKSLDYSVSSIHVDVAKEALQVEKTVAKTLQSDGFDFKI